MQHNEIGDLPALAVALAQHDAPQLRVPDPAPTPDTAPQSVAPYTLLRALTESSDSRAREALIALFLRHPEYHQYVPSLTAELGAPAALTLRHFYTAAVYLQHLWRSTLGLYLGAFAELPNYFGENEFGLPSPRLHWGESGLRRLATLFERETGVEWLSVYESAIARFFMQQEARAAVTL